MPEFVIGEWAYVEALKSARKDNNVDLVLAYTNAPTLEQVMGQAIGRAGRDRPHVDDRAELMARNKAREEARTAANGAEFPLAPRKSETPDKPADELTK